MSDFDKQLEAILDQLEKVGQLNDAIPMALEKAIKPAQADAKRLAPVDDGQLRNSIITYNTFEDGEHVANLTATAEHAVYNEYGTGPIGAASPKMLPPGVSPDYKTDKINKRKKKDGTEIIINFDGWFYKDKNGKLVATRGMPARPFMYPAWKQNEENMKTVFINALKSKLKD